MKKEKGIVQELFCTYSLYVSGNDDVVR